MNLKKFEHLDSQGTDWGITTVEQLWGDLFVIKYNKPEKRIPEDAWKGIFIKAKNEALQSGAQTVGVRLRLDYEPQIFQSILTEIGFKKQGGKLYHGGTHSENWPMRKLFEVHCCKFFCEMEEWAFYPERRS